MRSSSTEIGQRVRIFVGRGRVGVDEAASVGAEFLDHFLRRHRTAGDRLREAFDGFHALIGVKVLRHALPHEKQPDDDRDGQQNVERAAREVDPEISERLHVRAHQPPNDRDGDRNADPGRGEVVPGEPGHLREVAHRRLARIELPVRVRRKTDGGVPREVGRHVVDVGGVERKPLLRPQQNVEVGEADQGKCQHRERIGVPGHLLVFAHAAEPVDELLQRHEQGA